MKPYVLLYYVVLAECQYEGSYFMSNEQWVVSGEQYDMSSEFKISKGAWVHGSRTKYSTA